MKRGGLVGNPFIKLKNRTWEVSSPPRSLTRPISPPPIRSLTADAPSEEDEPAELPEAKLHETSLPSAAIEAGEVSIGEHLNYFSTKLSAFAKSPSIQANLPSNEFVDLYQRNQHSGGHHFVIHQHDHPIAGVHYDLRLQISATSSISFAIMYGLPGNPNSKRLNRNATETRVHNLWNHLIETASHQTGSLLIWDIGEYEILHRVSKHDPKPDPDSESDESSDPNASLSEPEKLSAAFQNRKIKLRLHGTKLPKNYTLSLRLTKHENRTEQPKKPVRKRRRLGPGAKRTDPLETPPSSDVEVETVGEASDEEIVPSQPQLISPKSQQASSSLEKEIQEQEDEEVRRTNAYPGATNSIGSIHQRKWYLSIDRVASGFYKAGKSPALWKRKGDEGFESFFVRGRDVERSVVTGRNADEIMDDEGVVGYIGRKGWRAVME